MPTSYHTCRCCQCHTHVHVSTMNENIIIIQNATQVQAQIAKNIYDYIYE
jgi:hypothetical protein